MNRGEVWWAALGAPVGSEPGYKRPVIIVQADSFNRSAIRTILAVVVTSNLRLAAAPGNVRLSARGSGLPRDSVANVSQVVTLGKAQLIERVARLSAPTLRRLDDGLRLVLGLT